MTRHPRPTVGVSDDPEARFRDYLAGFRREGQRYLMFVALYRYLHERRSDSLAELNVAPAFFQTVLTALRAGFIITAHNLVVGGRGDEVTLKTFLAFVGTNVELFSTEAFRARRNLPPDAWQVQKHEAPTTATVRADRKRVAQLAAVPSLKILRDKFHAHLDPEYFLAPERLSDDAPLRWGELDEIRIVASEILNRYSVAFDGNHFVFEPLNVLDVEEVIEALRAWRRR